jgi:hypothetical protein
MEQGNTMSERETTRHLLVVTSAGGVALDVLALADAYDGPRRFVAADAVDTAERLVGEDAMFHPEPEANRPLGLVAELGRAFAELGRRRPRLVLSAGTALAVPWFVAARVLRVPAVWVETLNIVDRQGRAARVCARLSTAVAVQRTERMADHRRAVFVGELY